VRRNYNYIRKKLEKDIYLKNHQMLKDMGEIESEDEEDF
jgi:hypothetical protein